VSLDEKLRRKFLLIAMRIADLGAAAKDALLAERISECRAVRMALTDEARACGRPLKIGPFDPFTGESDLAKAARR
jgi:hypothetical protein